MKYILTESQYQLINELNRMSGHYLIQPIYNLIEYYDKSLTKKQKIESFIDYYTNKLGVKLPDSLQRREIIQFFSFPHPDELPDEILQKDALSGFVYYIAKKYFDIKEGIDLDFFIAKDPIDGDKEFFFFDPTLKIFVGKIYTKKLDTLPGKSFRIKMSAADDELIGSGYGTKMYLTLIDRYDYIASDFSLFSGAYRMWRHVLPQYVNIWGVEETAVGEKYHKIDPLKRKGNKKFDYFVASKNEEIIQTD